MGYTAEQLDQWATWLETETSYSLAKFGTPEQLQYFVDGVATSEFSWKMSAVGYLNRAILRMEDGRPIPSTELRTVQELGKSEHNHITCAAIGQLAWGRAGSLLPVFCDMVEAWREALATRDIAPLELVPATVAMQNQGFDRLQELQDGNYAKTFDAHIRHIGLPVHAAFIDLAEQYGWPQSGTSSTQDARPWAPAFV